MNRAFLEKVASTAEGKIVLSERPLRPRADPAAGRGGAHRRRRRWRRRFTPKVVKQAEILEGVGMETRAAAARLRALPVAAHVGHDPDGGPRGSAAGALAVRAGPRRGVHHRRQEPLGGELGAPGPASTSSGRTSSATCCRTRRKARPPPISTARATNWWWITGSRAMWRSLPRRRIFSSSARTDSTRR